LSGARVRPFIPTQKQLLLGVPKQETGIRPARALPYELHAHGQVHAASNTFELEFSNTGKVGAVFQVRSGNPLDTVRMYTVEPGKKLTGTWLFVAQYDLTVYGPNGFTRYFKGSVGKIGSAAVAVRSAYGKGFDAGSIELLITNTGPTKATVILLDAYTGEDSLRLLRPGESFIEVQRLSRTFGWYDLIIKVKEDPTFESRLAGHVETGEDSFSDPALGGLVTLKT
jgi:phospholipase C